MTADIATATTSRLPRVRKIIASRMMESLQRTAQLTAVQEADVTEVVALRNRAKAAFAQAEGISLTFLPFFARALSVALAEHPEFNASIDAGGTQFTLHHDVHLGVAVDTQVGLMVPVIRHATTLTVPELARNIADLADRARTARLGPDEMSGSTFTLTNIGSAGTLTDTPIINYPEVAILGTGAIVRRPRIQVGPGGQEEIVVRSVCLLPLTYDHRLIDGAAAGRFLTTLRSRLEAANFESELAKYL